MKGDKNGSKLGWLVGVAALATVLAAGGCAAELTEESSAEDPEVSELAQELGGIVLPPTIPQLCYSSPNCSLTYQGGYQTQLQQLLGCSQTYQYMSGRSDGFMGGLASYCPDGPAARILLRNGKYPIYEPGFCDQCLEVPANQIFVFWMRYTGPVCPSSCAPSHPPMVP